MALKIKCFLKNRRREKELFELLKTKLSVKKASVFHSEQALDFMV